MLKMLSGKPGDLLQRIRGLEISLERFVRVPPRSVGSRPNMRNEKEKLVASQISAFLSQ